MNIVKEIQLLEEAIKIQEKANVDLYNSIPDFSQDTEEVNEWRQGQKEMRRLLNKKTDLLNKKSQLLNETMEEQDEVFNKVFVNSFGEATKREISNVTYEKQQRRTMKEVASFIGR